MAPPISTSTPAASSVYSPSCECDSPKKAHAFPLPVKGTVELSTSKLICKREDQQAVVLAIGDHQFHLPLGRLGLFRSLMAQSTFPGLRLPGMSWGTQLMFEALVFETLKKETEGGCLGKFRGMYITGDVNDINTSPEWNAFVASYLRILKVSPALRILLQTVGNHESFYSGAVDKEFDFIIIGWILNLLGPEKDMKDVTGPETDSMLLNKKKVLDRLYEDILKKDLKAAELIHYDYQKYLMRGGRTGKWNNPHDIFRDFWAPRKDDKNESWHVYVRLKPKEVPISDPEKNLIHVSAAKIQEFDTKSGKVPVYFINLDTMDYSEDHFFLRAIKGHVSSKQVKIVRGFMEEMKQRNSNARFILGGHYHPGQIANIQNSGLVNLLSDEAVISYIGAHIHERDYYDARSLEGVNRRTPLPVVVASSAMDNNEALYLELKLYPYKGENPAYKGQEFIQLKFKYVGIGPDDIPKANTAVVEDEFKKIAPHLLTYLPHINHIEVAKMRRVASPFSNLWDRIYDIFSLDHGLFWKKGAVNDRGIKNDVIPGMIQSVLLDMRLTKSLIRISLTEAGIDLAAIQVYESAFNQRVARLMEYYERILQGKYTNVLDAHEAALYVDEGVDQFAVAKINLLGAIRKAKPHLDNEEKKLIHFAEHIVSVLPLFLEESFKTWLRSYEVYRRNKRPASEYVALANLYASDHIKMMRDHVKRIPYGSQTAAFLLRVAIASKEYAEKWLGKVNEKEVPDTISYFWNPKTGQVLASKLPRKRLDEEIEAIKERWLKELDVEMRGKISEMKARIPAAEDSPKIHIPVRLGLQENRDSIMFQAHTGIDAHLVQQRDFPLLSLNGELGLITDFKRRLGGSLNLSFLVGDPYGLIELGPAGTVGVMRSFEDGAVTYSAGVGGELRLFEMWLMRYSHLWYFGKGPTFEDNQFIFSADFYRGIEHLINTGGD